MGVKELIEKYYIEIIIAGIILLLFWGGFFIESRSEYLKGDWMNRSGSAVLKAIISLL